MLKSLLDIQQDIHILEKNIQEINECVKSIGTDIETIRNSSEDITLDYSKIEVLAKQIDLGEHPLSKLKDRHSCQIYLEMLLNIVRLDPDDEAAANRMVFIQWLQMQSHIDLSLEDLYLDCLKTDEQLFYEMSEIISKDYKEYFLVDALIVANITGMANKEIYKYIADAITVLGVSGKDVKGLAFVSKVSLSQNLSGVSDDDLKVLGDKVKEYGHYIRSDLVEKVFAKLRVVAVEVPDNETMLFAWKVEQQQAVKSGDMIAAYRTNKRIDGGRGNSKNIYLSKRRKSLLDSFGGYELVEVKAPVSGTIFQFRDNNTNYGVIAQEQDNEESIKAWIKAGK
ncbi:hypothetical protein DW721_03370 [Clostridium sp. AM27-31LB]|uniref:hypothetical protein n=1 Tax=Clostridium sp. AM27-31LB TaxID=2293026 RepID=UPI000E493B41|nr:hypothetical protein [Clostridium sp. AM27-31LB]RHT96415.1 hypothetical protein DW721_03370 [Clostridium sp. AM27-31LB]